MRDLAQVQLENLRSRTRSTSNNRSAGITQQKKKMGGDGDTSLRPATSGFMTGMCLSKRPGRIKAGSSDSGKLVAPMRMTPSLGAKPSSSESSWLIVPSR